MLRVEKSQDHGSFWVGIRHCGLCEGRQVNVACFRQILYGMGKSGELIGQGRCPFGRITAWWG